MKALLVAGLLAASVSVAAGQAPAPTDRTLQLQFHDDGTVTLSARNVTPSDVLLAWAGQCECFVVNGNRLTAPVLTTPILFERAPQAVVLRSLLSQAGGYVLTPRRAGSTAPSLYETIYILPTSASAPSPFMSPGGPIAFQPVPNPTTGAPDDEIPPVSPIRIPEPIDPTRGAKPTQEPAAPTSTAPTPGMSLPGVRVVPVTPVTSTPSPAPGTQPAAPGSVTPARTP